MRQRRSESPVKRTRPQSESSERNNRTRCRVQKVINTISRGFAGGECSNSTRKKHLWAIQSAHSTSTWNRPRMASITFTNNDFIAIDPAQDDAMVIIVEIDKFAITKVLMDQGSSVDILYWRTFKKMRIPETEIQPYDEQIVRFSSEHVDTRGFIDLCTIFGEEGSLSKTKKIRYLLVNANTSYNILLGRSSIKRLKAIVSTLHLAMKFPSTAGDIVTIHVDHKVARECYVASLKVKPTRLLYRATPRDRSCKRERWSTERRSYDRRMREHMIALVDLDPQLDESCLEPVENLCPLPLRDDDHKTHIGTSLKPDDNKAVSQTLIDNIDFFLWIAADMPDVSLDIITHLLSIYKEARSVVQKKMKDG